MYEGYECEREKEKEEEEEEEEMRLEENKGCKNEQNNINNCTY